MRYNPEIEAEALRRTQWNAENTQNPVDQYIYHCLQMEQKRRRERKNRGQRVQYQIKELYVNQRLSMEKVADVLGLDIAWLSSYIYENKLNELRPVGKDKVSTKPGIPQGICYLK